MNSCSRAQCQPPPQQVHCSATLQRLLLKLKITAACGLSIICAVPGGSAPLAACWVHCGLHI